MEEEVEEVEVVRHFTAHAWIVFNITGERKFQPSPASDIISLAVLPGQANISQEKSKLMFSIQW